MRDSKSTFKQFFIRTVFFWLQYCLSATGSSPFKGDLFRWGFIQNENLFRWAKINLSSNQTVLYVNVFNSVVLCEQMKFNPSHEIAACKKRMVILVTYNALLKYTCFLGVDKRKNQINASERFQFGKYIRIITRNFYQVTELMTDFSMQDLKSTSKHFFSRTIFFLALILFVSYRLVTFQKR